MDRNNLQQQALTGLRRQGRFIVLLTVLAAVAAIPAAVSLGYMALRLARAPNPWPAGVAVVAGSLAALAGGAGAIGWLLALRRDELAWLEAAARSVGCERALECELEPVPVLPARRRGKNSLPMVKVWYRPSESARMRGEVIEPRPLCGGQAAGLGLLWRVERGGKTLHVVAASQGVVQGLPLAAPEVRARLTRRFRSITALAALLGLVLCGIMAGVQGLQLVEFQDQWRNAAASRDWPLAPGRIEASFVRTVRVTQGKRSVTAFEPGLRYTYDVDGKTLTGSRLRFGQSPAAARSEAEALVRLYPAGARVSVAYDPARPVVAVLQPGHENVLRQRMNHLVILLSLLPLPVLAASGLLYLFLPAAAFRQQEPLLAWIENQRPPS